MVRKTFFLVFALAGLANADAGFSSTIKVKDAGGSPSCVAGQLTVSAGSLSCSGEVATITTSGASLSSTNTWTGGNTFVSSVTVSTAVYFSTGSYANFEEYTLPSYVDKSTVTWQNGNKQFITLTANVTFVFNDPPHSANLVLRIATGGGGFTASWPGSVKWSAGTAPTITATTSKNDICSFYYSKQTAIYYGVCSQNF